MLTIFSKQRCPFCDQAKKLLEIKGVPFNEILVDNNEHAKEFLREEGHRTVPQIYQGSKLFVRNGFQGLKEMSDEELRASINSGENSASQ